MAPRFLTATLDGGERSFSRHGGVTVRSRLGPTTRLDDVAKR
jgi:hypothetical protein